MRIGRRASLTRTLIGLQLGLLLVMLAAVPLFYAVVPNVLGRAYTDLSHLLVLLEQRP